MTLDVSYELEAPWTPLSNDYVATVASALSSRPRLSAHLYIDNQLLRGVGESEVKSQISRHFRSQPNFSRDVFDQLDNAFLAKEWGKMIVSDQKYEDRWVTTPIGNAIGDKLRDQLGLRMQPAKLDRVVKSLGLMAHESRVAITRTLERLGVIKREQLAQLVVPRSSLGFHLTKLVNAGVVAVDPDSCKVDQNEMPEAVYPGKNFDQTFGALKIILTGIEKAPDLRSYPIWHFMNAFSKGFRETPNKHFGTSKFTFDISLHEAKKIRAEETLRDFLDSDVAMALVLKNDLIVGLVKRNEVVSDVVSKAPVQLTSVKMR